MNSRFDTLTDDLEPGEHGPDYDEADWNTLVDTVCEVYRRPRKQVISFLRSHDLCTPRHLVAAIWSETHTLEDTTIRCRWRAHKNVYHARDRIARIITTDVDGPKIRQVLTLLSRRAPWLIARAIEAGLAPNPDDTNPENPDEKNLRKILNPDSSPII